VITIFGHLLCYRNKLDEHRRCFEGNPEYFVQEFEICVEKFFVNIGKLKKHQQELRSGRKCGKHTLISIMLMKHFSKLHAGNVETNFGHLV
jgi:hypothetical protein